MRKVAVIASASGCGKTTVGRLLATRLGVPFVELDALNHGPGWTEATAEQLRARVAPIVATDGWVIDGGYRGKLGDLVLEAADTVVWLDLPRREWLPRLFRRTVRRIVRREELWGGNRESFGNAFLMRDGLLRFAWRNYGVRRATYPSELARFHVVRLRSQREVDAWLASITGEAVSADAAARPPALRAPRAGP
ncbi:MAG TPA: shikimate kinase [Gaiella sp.]|jgi:adenylate kinase family enzyme|nr:shikimate kinase [Gaiella sp.]